MSFDPQDDSQQPDASTNRDPQTFDDLPIDDLDCLDCSDCFDEGLVADSTGEWGADDAPPARWIWVHPPPKQWLPCLCERRYRGALEDVGRPGTPHRG